jgi:carboxymethylenebutenolidase
MGKTISFSRTSGGTASGYLAEAQDAGAPAVVVIQEWWGLQGQVRGVCDRFAAAGFTALAPDLFEGRVVPYHDPHAAEAAMNALDFKGATDEVVRGAVRHLKAGGGKVGLTGFCMGGALTVIGAVHVAELDAAVVFYGVPPESVAAPEQVRVPLQAHFANQDDWCTPDVVNAFEQKLRASGKTFEIHRYDARHAFMNSERKDAYDDAAARLAWDRCLEFFGRHLR